MSTLTHAVSATLDDRLHTLSRVLGIIRRRSVGVRSLVVGPSGAGRSRLVAILQADADTAERVALVLAKVVGVRDASSWPADADSARGLAVIRVRRTGAEDELLDTLRLFHATVLAEDDATLTAELSGPDAFVVAALRALEPWGVVDVARTGALPLSPSNPAAS